ncbi:PepSY domain-containing protein [Nocardioides marmoraquaticus]
MTLTARAAATIATPLCVVLLAGCGGGDTAPADDAARDSDDGVVTLEPDPSATGSSTGSPAPSASAAPQGQAQGPPILRAAVTAQRALPAATVVGVEDDDEDVRGWEVDVVRPNGETVELVVAPGGGRVTLGPTPVEGDDDLSGLVGQVRVDVVEALRSGVRAAPDGTVSSIQLEEEDGAPIWQVDLVDAGGVRVDAVTGASSPDD